MNQKYEDPEIKKHSKYQINQKIPKSWQLKTEKIDFSLDLETQYSKLEKEFCYPFYLKPEWGQNSVGVYRVANKKQLQSILPLVYKNKKRPYICQQSGKFENEYEIFFIFDNQKIEYFSCILSEYPSILGNGKDSIKTLIKEKFSSHHHNNSLLDEYPESFVPPKDKKIPISLINGVYEGTVYKEQQIKKETQKLWFDLFQKIDNFFMFRITISAKDTQNITNGTFQVIEINLLNPLPLNILDQEQNWNKVKKEIKDFTNSLMRLTKKKKSSYFS